ncbi:MAG TPA: CotH kinase family protein [Bacteroidia bacterium]|nr:CotH kinase family protein [Bacteroidia bacterium]
MRILFSIFVLVGLLTGFTAKAQSSTALWDDSRVSAVYLTIHPDSLDSIYTDIYSDHYYMAEMVFDDGQARDTVAMVGLRLRGNTSRSSGKKSFKISFNEYMPGRRYQGTKKLNLNGEHNDPTMVREKLFYEIWNQSGMPPRRTTFVEVYINQTYHGLYTCLEEFDKDWLMGVFAEDNGNLYKCTYPADLVYQGTNQQAYKNIFGSGGRAYDLQTNETQDDYTDLVELITQLDRLPDAQFAADIHQYLNVAGYLKALAIDVATGNWDSYAYNKNNYFLYHHLGSNQFEFISYDTDNTLGVDWVNRDWATRDCADWLSHSEPRPLASKLLAVPAFRTQYYAALDSITRFITRPDSIFPRIDAIKALVLPYVAADTFRSLDYGYLVNDFHLGFTGTVDGHTPYGIKPFLQTRYNSTLSQLPTVAQAGANDIAQSILVFPNPVGQGQSLHLHAKVFLRHDLKVTFVDALGHTVLQMDWPAYERNLEIGLEPLPAGKYWAVFQGKDVYGSLGFVRN